MSLNTYQKYRDVLDVFSSRLRECSGHNCVKSVLRYDKLRNIRVIGDNASLRLASRAVVPDAGHLPSLERPAVFNRLLKSFLAAARLNRRAA